MFNNQNVSLFRAYHSFYRIKMLFVFSAIFYSPFSVWADSIEDELKIIMSSSHSQKESVDSSSATELSDFFSEILDTPENGTNEGTLPATWQSPITGTKFIHVPSGCFRMGKKNEATELYNHAQPIHEVCVDGFYIAETEVRQDEFEKITGKNPSGFNKGGEYPVENISWSDVQVFFQKLKSKSGKHFRLPTEAEWEYAARFGAENENDSVQAVGTYSWYRANSANKTHPVGSKTANTLGLFDMGGNVMEMCSDWYGPYSSVRKENPTGAKKGSHRVSRGGSWMSVVEFVHPGKRYWSDTSAKADLGFRLVLSEKAIGHLE